MLTEHKWHALRGHVESSKLNAVCRSLRCVLNAFACKVHMVCGSKYLWSATVEHQDALKKYCTYACEMNSQCIWRECIEYSRCSALYVVRLQNMLSTCEWHEEDILSVHRNGAAYTCTRLSASKVRALHVEHIYGAFGLTLG